MRRRTPPLIAMGYEIPCRDVFARDDISGAQMHTYL